MLTGVILAGGQKTIEGMNRALLPFGHETLVERQARTMKKLCSEVILVTNDPRAFLPILGDTVRIITDYVLGKGVLSGMHAAFNLTNNENLWVVGCGMPFISPRAAQLILNQKRESRSIAAIPKLEGRHYPLHGIYDKSTIEYIIKLLDLDEFSAHRLLDVIRFSSVEKELFRQEGIPLDFVKGINSSEEYTEVLQQLKLK